MSKSKRARSIIASGVVFTVAAMFSASLQAGAKSSDGVWEVTAIEQARQQKSLAAQTWVQPRAFGLVELHAGSLSQILDLAPMEFSAAAAKSATVLSLPTPDGGFERFSVVESPIMEAPLAQAMADLGWPMKTYSGVSLERPATTVRLDWGGPNGFHAAVKSPSASYFIDPYWKNEHRYYASYLRSEYPLQAKQGSGVDHPLQCGVGSEALPALPSERIAKGSTTTGGNLRTYRLANAASAEYTAFFGGKTQAQAGIVTSINRVNQLWANDLSVRLILVGNNLDIVYTDAGTDPYANSCVGAELDANDANITAVIGDANFDLGHVFVTGGGGLAGGVPCQNGSKASGCTGSTNPVGDPFDIDFVAHEMGHQFAAGHTWNGSTAACSADNFDAQSAYEPGSGSTVLGYAGICGADNIQTRSDSYYHRRSLDSMLSRMNGFSNCFAVMAGANPNPPTVSAPANAIIPIGTPFELTATGGGDADPGDAANLTYVWEQFDLGTQAALAAGAVPVDDGVQPIFRSFSPSTSPTRIFPSPTAGATPVGEVLPSTNRTMNFKVTVRDNKAGGGRESSATVQVTSNTAGGPFRVIAPNGGENWSGMQTVTWNVASTNAAPFNVANVSILLSTDGGLTFPTTLLASTPNDGTETVTIPGVSSTSARIKVKALGNMFFDSTDANFLVGATSDCISPNMALMDPGSITSDLVINSANTIADLDLTLQLTHSWVGDLVVSLQRVGGTSVVLIDRPGVPASAQGCSRDNIDAVLDDEATSPVENQCNTTPPAINGRFTPNNPLSAFDGQNLGGTWRLTVTDNFAQDTGTLTRWCLSATKPVVSTTIFHNGFE